MTDKCAIQAAEHDQLVPDSMVADEFGISAMTLWRWERDARLQFPPAVVIRTRKYRQRSQLEAFKARMIKNAMRDRARPKGSTIPRPTMR